MGTSSTILLALIFIPYSYSRAIDLQFKNPTEPRKNEPEVQISVHIEPDKIWKMAVASYFILIFIGILINCFLIFYCDPCILPMVLWMQGEEELDCLEHYTLPDGTMADRRNSSAKEESSEPNELIELL